MQEATQEAIRKTIAATLAAVGVSVGTGMLLTGVASAQQPQGQEDGTPAVSQSASPSETASPSDQPTDQPTDEPAITWQADIDGTPIPLTMNDDGVLTATHNTQTPPPASITATSSDGTSITLTEPTQYDTIDDTGTPGTVRHTATLDYTADASGTQPAIRITINAEWTAGTPLTVTSGDGHANGFTSTGPDTAETTLTLTDPTTKTITLSDGTTLPVTWQDTPTLTPNPDGNGLTLTHTGTATGDTTSVDGHQWRVTVHTTSSTLQTWTAHIDGQDTHTSTLPDGTQTLTTSLSHQAPDTITMTSSDGHALTLTGTTTGMSITDTGILGITRIQATTRYTMPADPATGTPGIDISIPWTQTQGEETLLNLPDGSSMSLTGTGTDETYTAETTTTLDDSNKPAIQTLTLSDGTSMPIEWQGTPQATTRTVTNPDGSTSTITYMTLQGTADTTLTSRAPDGQTLSQHAHITIWASRAQDTHFTLLNVKTTSPQGETSSIPLPSDHGTSITLTLPHAQLTNTFTLETEHGVDATVSPITQTLNTDGSRTLGITANNTPWTVTLRFQAADIQADSPARLTGIHVQADGRHATGPLIDNWDPNRLSYTLTIGENQPSPYILPTYDPQQVTVTPLGVTKTADATSMEWKVTSLSTQETRTYRVTVIRQHAWKTAVETFTPVDPTAITPDTTPLDSKDTTLESVGWTAVDGTYTPMQGDSWQIPEGGVFAYKAKTGQTVSVSSRRTTGMTFEYTLTVLPEDHSQPVGQHTVTVTYITTQTHEALLQGLSVNGRTINGFDPGKHEYTVNVNDTDKWTLDALYDKTTGMTVSVSKTGQTATVTVTSGDGLTKTVYTVHADKNPLPLPTDGMGGTIGMGGSTLASTGSMIRGILIGMLGMLGMGVGLHTGARRMRGMRHTTRQD